VTVAEVSRPETALAAPVLDVVIPVHNEEAELEGSVERVRQHLLTLPWSFRLTVADNASTDGTALVARRLAQRYDEVRALHLPEKGRGRALKAAWSESDAAVLVYMDVDLSTDLNALLPLVAPLLSGHSDLAIGSRLSRGARTVRGPKREVVSRSYNLLLRGTLRARFSDAQCGFKAIRAEVAHSLLPVVHDDAWFFDTELLVLAERTGLRIHEVPVDWVDDPDSRVDIVRTALDDLRGIARLGWSLTRGRVPLGDLTRRLGRTTSRAGSGQVAQQVVVFSLVGVASTVAYALLYLVFRQQLTAGWANAAALVATAVGNTAANRRWTFGVTGSADAVRHHTQGLAILAAGLVVTTAALGLLHAVAAQPPRWLEVAVLTAANLGVTLMRFVLLRVWVFRRHDSPEEGS
jgi:putative flippase GtrA